MIIVDATTPITAAALHYNSGEPALMYTEWRVALDAAGRPAPLLTDAQRAERVALVALLQSWCSLAA